MPDPVNPVPARRDRKPRLRPPDGGLGRQPRPICGRPPPAPRRRPAVQPCRASEPSNGRPSPGGGHGGPDRHAVQHEGFSRFPHAFSL